MQIQNQIANVDNIEYIENEMLTPSPALQLLKILNQKRFQFARSVKIGMQSSSIACVKH